MLRSHRIFFTSLLMAATLSVPYVVTAESSRAVAGAVEPLRDAVYGHTLDETQIRALHKVTLERISIEIEETENGCYARALANYFLGRFYQALKTRGEMAAYAAELRAGRYLALKGYYHERDSAMAAYRAAKKDAECYVELAPGAEAHRLYGEILGQMLFLGDIGDIIGIGTKARKNVQIALEIDPSLTKARIQEASRLAYSPTRYGGDPDEARNMYRSILRDGGVDREDLFNIYGGFAMASFMEEEDEEALSWFEEALDIYPGNIFSAGMADFLRGELK
ncbi:MAG: hypothetical protein RQ801_00615 [Spirochaetaceae bacterium]|nr:hypothetical protein [Spirochaetaceae bacterium]MDT8296771.1 hypothetical protein [Spirochaetaceae bacterium]